MNMIGTDLFGTYAEHLISKRLCKQYLSSLRYLFIGLMFCMGKMYLLSRERTIERQYYTKIRTLITFQNK